MLQLRVKWYTVSVKCSYCVGIDEVGRGPLAGPVGVGVAMVSADFDWELLPGVTDSKKLTEKKRGEIFEAARKLKASGQLDYAVVMVGAAQIDINGIVPSIYSAMEKALKKLEVPSDALLKLDGGLCAPEQFVYQETIIKGDAKEKTIGLASIVAKVMRDRYMVRKSSETIFAPYDFATHKGYGTKKHREAIAQYGLSPEHRQSYCKNIILL